MAKKSNFSEIVKLGFGLSLGGYFLSILVIIISMALFVPGYIMVKSGQKKENTRDTKDSKDSTSTKKVIGYILMALGMVFGFGFGASAFFSVLGNDI